MTANYNFISFKDFINFENFIIKNFACFEIRNFVSFVMGSIIKFSNFRLNHLKVKIIPHFCRN